MCGTEQSKLLAEGEYGQAFDSLWQQFTHSEKFNHDEMAEINPDGKAFKAHTEQQAPIFDLASIIKGNADKFGVKQEKNNMENDNATYVTAVFKGFIKQLEATEVSYFQYEN